MSGAIGGVDWEDGNGVRGVVRITTRPTTTASLELLVELARFLENRGLVVSVTLEELHFRDMVTAALDAEAAAEADAEAARDQEEARAIDVEWNR